MYRISAVSYLNTKPFIYGLYRSPLADLIQLSLDIPAVCAQKLSDGRTDLALAPVAVIPDLDNVHLISDYCIGANGPVRTVCLFSEVPLEAITHIYLDFHSRTSVALVQVLCREYWQIAPVFLPASEGFESRIAGTTAGVIIGDRAFGYHDRFAYVYDLSEAWTEWTGLPFVFAAWMSTRPLPQEFLHPFNDALRAGIEHIPELIQILPTMPVEVDLPAYFRQNIIYTFDAPQKAALERFLGYVRDIGVRQSREWHQPTQAG
jgi:chorismate dehydratase